MHTKNMHFTAFLQVECSSCQQINRFKRTQKKSRCE